MDIRLQKIIDEAQMKFGLDAYRLEKYQIYKERDNEGAAFYSFNMEWFPKELNEPIEEDYNPDGTAIVKYNIERREFYNVSFVQDVSFSTMTHFPTKQVEEVTAWIEKESGLTSESDFKLTDAHAFGFRYESFIDGISISPGCTIEVALDEAGKLTSFHKHGEIPIDKSLEKSVFSLTLEEIEPLVKSQIQLVNYPFEADQSLIPIYLMKEVFVTVDGARMIPFMEHERAKVKVDEVIKWTEPLKEKINREEVPMLCEATVEEGFSNVGTLEKLTLTEEQIEQSKAIVRDVLRAEYPDESGKWKLKNLGCQENFIEAHCEMIEEDLNIFSRKVVVFIETEHMSVLNFMDNSAMLEVFDAFMPAEKVTVTHDEAFEKMLPYISLDPTYV